MYSVVFFLSQPKKTRVRSFRLSSGLLEKLDRATKRARKTENSFVSDVLMDRLTVDPLLPAFQEIRLSSVTFQSIVNTTSIDALEVAASEMAQKNIRIVRELYASNDRVLDFKEVIALMGNYAHWFYIEGDNGFRGQMTLRHGYGLKWSRFVRAFLLGAYGVLSNEELSINADEQFVHVNFGASSVKKYALTPLFFSMIRLTPAFRDHVSSVAVSFAHLHITPPIELTALLISSTLLILHLYCVRHSLRIAISALMDDTAGRSSPTPLPLLS
jgi:hypothetical protein